MQKKTSMQCLETIKNAAKVKLKIKESLDILPKKIELLLDKKCSPDKREKKGVEDAILKTGEKTPVKELEDISLFIKTEKKLIKQSSKKRKIFTSQKDLNDGVGPVANFELFSKPDNKKKIKG